VLPLAAVLLLSACTTARQVSVCAPLDAGAGRRSLAAPIAQGRIALAAGRNVSPVTHIDKIADDRPPPGVPVGRNPASGAAIGALGGASLCAPLVFLFPPAMVGCLAVAGPVLVTAGAVAGGVAGGAAAADDEESGAVRRAEEARREFDRQVSEREAAQQNVSSMAAAIDLNRRLVDKTRALARESGLGDFDALADQGPRELNAPPRYVAPYDYVLELALTERVLTSTGSIAAPDFAFGFSVQGRLVRMGDNAVVRTYVATDQTDTRGVAAWTAEGGKPFQDAIDRSLDRLASTALEHWLKPALRGADEGKGKIVVIRPERRGGWYHPAEISIDGCAAGTLNDGTHLVFELSAGHHILRSEATWWSGDAMAAETGVDLEAGQTKYYFYFFLSGGKTSSMSEIDRAAGENAILHLPTKNRSR